MRGYENRSDVLFLYVSPESFVPEDHPLRPIRLMADKALASLSREFERMYSHTGRPSVPPEVLLKSLLLQILFSIRSNRLLVEQLGYNILYRWFLGLSLEEKIWDHSTFSQNQERLIGTDVAGQFLQRIIAQATEARLLSKDHFSVDGTLIEAWASIKSFHPRDEGPRNRSGRNDEVDFHEKRLENDTHVSTTDPESRLYRKGKGKESKLCYMGHHTLMENRNGLAVNARVTKASGTAERQAAIDMLGDLPGKSRVTVGGDKAYDTKEFVSETRGLNVTPHVAQNTKNRASAIDDRTTRHAGYPISQRKRKRVEEIFGWLKTVGFLRKTRHRGTDRVGWMFTFGVAVYNLVRMRNMMEAPA